jgi:asparagine synthase (glutamine-hydrolysing)
MGELIFISAHRRLSIIDLSAAGASTDVSADGRIWICFQRRNIQLSRVGSELRSLGNVFRTESDTEVVITAYVEWGEECLDRFDGCRAFVLYDAHRNALFGSRDRFGVKPLYYVFDQRPFRVCLGDQGSPCRTTEVRARAKRFSDIR